MTEHNSGSRSGVQVLSSDTLWYNIKLKALNTKQIPMTTALKHLNFGF